MIRAVLPLAVALVLPGPAAAQLRNIPEASLRGTIAHVAESIVRIDGRVLRLAPGARIRDGANLTIVPTSLPPAGALARYLVDAHGQIAQVWLLTPDEAARRVPGSDSR